MNSNSNRNSLFSVISGISQATTLSNRSLSRSTPPERFKGGLYPQQQDNVHRQASPIVELTEPINQYPLTPIKQNPPAGYICVSCNISFTNKSSLSRHHQEHCERKVVWLCRFCVPKREFYRKEKLSRHHLDHHGVDCVEGCKDHGRGLCDWHLPGSILNLPAKKAWGCPCCLRWFGSCEAWEKHSVNHAVENGQVVGWSLSTMVQSLLFQPFLGEAIARSPLPLQMFHLSNVKVDICQNLREALERHKLPDAVQAHYDYRHLQLPEALALYAFRLVAYGEPFLDDVSAGTSAADTMGNVPNRSHGRLEGQPFAPPVQNVSIPPASDYWDPQDPFNYSPQTRQTVEPEIVPDRPHGDILAVAGTGNHGMGSSRVSGQHLPGTDPVQFYGQTLQDVSAIASSEQPPSMQTFANPGRAFHEPNGGEKGRGRALSVKRSLQNLVHRPSSSKPSTSRTEKISLAPGIPDGRALERNRTVMTLETHRESTRAEPMEAVPSSPRQARLSGRMSGIQWDAFVTWHPDEQHDS